MHILKDKTPVHLFAESHTIRRPAIHGLLPLHLPQSSLGA
jgi:hypothetical protein